MKSKPIYAKSKLTGRRRAKPSDIFNGNGDVRKTTVQYEVNGEYYDWPLEPRNHFVVSKFGKNQLLETAYKDYKDRLRWLMKNDRLYVVNN